MLSLDMIWLARQKVAAIFRDSSLISTRLKGIGHTNPKRERGMQQLPGGKEVVPRRPFGLVFGVAREIAVGPNVLRLSMEIGEESLSFRANLRHDLTTPIDRETTF
jgi:hypothetical protein